MTADIVINENESAKRQLQLSLFRLIFIPVKS